MTNTEKYIEKLEALSNSYEIVSTEFNTIYIIRKETLDALIEELKSTIEQEEKEQRVTAEDCKYPYWKGKSKPKPGDYYESIIERDRDNGFWGKQYETDLKHWEIANQGMDWGKIEGKFKEWADKNYMGKVLPAKNIVNWFKNNL